MVKIDSKLQVTWKDQCWCISVSHYVLRKTVKTDRKVNLWN
jgi:hypothetical protein